MTPKERRGTHFRCAVCNTQHEWHMLTNHLHDHGLHASTRVGPAPADGEYDYRAWECLACGVYFIDWVEFLQHVRTLAVSGNLTEHFVKWAIAK